MICRSCLLVVILALVCAPEMACAQYSGILGLSGMPNLPSSLDQGVGQTSVPWNSSVQSQRPTYFTLGLRKYIASFTSYQFPDNPPFYLQGNNPQSRLEWPWDQTFGVVRLGSNSYGIQVNFEGAATLSPGSSLKAQDSDWDYPGNSGQKSAFSDADDYPRSWMFDTNIGYVISALPSVQWLLGYRAQQLRFTYTDMLQRSLGSGPFPTMFAPGEVIQFSQHYKIPYLGAALLAQLPYNFFVKLSGDYGTVTADNVDYHVLRTPAPRFTFESTSGVCWHANLLLQYWFKGFASLALVGDLMTITTYGGHHWTEPGWDQSWEGAKVWSEQKYVEINATLWF